jgi:uncharacterized protein
VTAVAADVAHMPVVRDLKGFSSSSGSPLERAVFNHRWLFLLLCGVVTAVLAVLATRVTVNASFVKMIPTDHPYIKNYLQYKDDLKGLGNTLQVIVANPTGDIFDPRYLETLRQLNDDLFLTPGVDRGWVRSLWMPIVRWTEVTEEGFQGGPVMPDGFNGSFEAVAQLRLNAARAGIVGSLVANDFKSSAIVLPLLDRTSDGKPLNYSQLSHLVEELRQKYETGMAPDGRPWGVQIHVTGFAKLVGDLLDGLVQVAKYFGIATLIATALLYAYTRCVRSTLLVVTCSLVAVVWQVGLVQLAGLELDPYSMLVPFLVFAIGVSHGAQKMNGIMQDIGRGTHRLVAARYTFRRLFLAGVTALLADAVGFAVLVLIPIPVIRELALTASIGVAVLVVTNLLLIPVLLSYVGVSKKAAARSLEVEQAQQRGEVGALWRVLNRFASQRSCAASAVVVATVIGVAGFFVSLRLHIGDLDPGAPELRADSRYNRDGAFVAAHYSLSSDVFALIVKTPPGGCVAYDTLAHVDKLAWELQQLPQVRATLGLHDVIRQITAGTFEGNVKWLTISRNQDVLNFGAQQASVSYPELFNRECSVLPLITYLSDHKAETLASVLKTFERFNQEHPTDATKLQVLPVAAWAGIEAVTNIVVESANRMMLLYVYAAVIALCFITFRSWRAVVVAVVPLILTSLLCEALMVALGIGVKVATLPVIALGVGIHAALVIGAADENALHAVLQSVELRATSAEQASLCSAIHAYSVTATYAYRLDGRPTLPQIRPEAKPRLDPVTRRLPPAPPRASAHVGTHRIVDVRRIPIKGHEPEDVVVDASGRLLCGLKGGKIIRISPDGGSEELVGETGGRPLGLEVLQDGRILVCDAHKGLLRLDPDSGEVDTLVRFVNDVPLRFCSNAAAARDGTIWFTESTSRFDFEQYVGAMLEHRPSGRLFRRDPDGTVAVVLEDLHFPNGLTLVPDESALFFVETDGYCLKRLWLEGPRAGECEVVVGNLPGFADNVSRFQNGRFWVAIVGPRSPQLDRIGTLPGFLRRLIWRMPESKMSSASDTLWTMAFDEHGRQVVDAQSNVDTFFGATGVAESNGKLYFASVQADGLLEARIVEV